MEPTRHEMLFANPAFQDGLNLTVRDTNKWMKLNPGDPFDIKRPGKDDVLFTARVVGVLHIPFIYFRSSPFKELLAFMHSGVCTYAELFCDMRNTYPGFSATNPVTVVFFTIDKNA